MNGDYDGDDNDYYDNDGDYHGDDDHPANIV